MKPSQQALIRPTNISSGLALNFLDNHPLHILRICKRPCHMAQIRPKRVQLYAVCYTGNYELSTLQRIHFSFFHAPKAWLFACNMPASTRQEHVNRASRWCLYARNLNALTANYTFSCQPISCLLPPCLLFFSILNVSMYRFRGQKQEKHSTKSPAQDYSLYLSTRHRSPTKHANVSNHALPLYHSPSA